MKRKGHKMHSRPLGNPTDKAWITGWEASIAFEANPYTRRPQRVAFERGREAGMRQSADDV